MSAEAATEAAAAFDGVAAVARLSSTIVKTGTVAASHTKTN